MRFTYPALLLYLVYLVTSAGCGPSDRARLGQVAGTVTYEGQPIASGSIIFEVSGARPATGKIADGQITEVTTYEANDGVPLGQARIAVFATETGSSSQAMTPDDPSSGPKPGGYDRGPAPKSLIPEKYNDPASSGLAWGIKAGQNTVTLDLTD